MGNKINNRVTHNYHSTQKSIPTEGGRVGKVGGGIPPLPCYFGFAVRSSENREIEGALEYPFGGFK